MVIGSGAAGLMAALTALDAGLAVTVLEADGLIGGATALSEGMIWVPNTPEALTLPGAPTPGDEAGAALTYLRAASGNRFDEVRARAYLTAAPRALSLAQRAAGLSFTLNRSSRDYYPDLPGATVGTRALNPLPQRVHGMDRGLFAQLRPPLGTMVLFGGLSIASRDLPDYLNVGRSPLALLRVARHVARYTADRLFGWPRGTRLGNGNVIVALLAGAVVRQGGTILTGRPATRLFTEGGRVIGVEASGRKMMAARGVILATGGLNAHPRARRALLGPQPHIALPAPAEVPHLSDLLFQVGAAPASEPSQPVLWAPASIVPQGLARSGPWPHFSDRAKPGVICLGPDGRRFANEAQVYHDFVPAMIAATGRHAAGPHCWIMTDHLAMRRYGLGPIGPFPVRLGPYLRVGYLRRGATPALLAREIGLDPDTVTATLARFNDQARQGCDPDFGRGTSVYDRGNGDPAHGPNPSLGALALGPFYAIRLVPGDIGCFVGAITDADARVLDASGAVIPGLWAAGSAAAPLTGGTYPAAGLTIGQAMTFGYVAGQDAAGFGKDSE